MEAPLETLDITEQARRRGISIPEGVTVVARLYEDDESNHDPAALATEATQALLKRHRRGDWLYVTVLVTVYAGGMELGGDSLSGVASGQLSRDVSAHPLTDEHPIWDHDMVSVAIREARTRAAKIPQAW